MRRQLQNRKPGAGGRGPGRSWAQGQVSASPAPKSVALSLCAHIVPEKLLKLCKVLRYLGSSGYGVILSKASIDWVVMLSPSANSLCSIVGILVIC